MKAQKGMTAIKIENTKIKYIKFFVLNMFISFFAVYTIKASILFSISNKNLNVIKNKIRFW